MDQDNPNDLIPLGAPAPGFDVVIRGYDRSQVAEALERLEQDVRVTVGERDQAIARANQLHQQLEAVSGEVAGLNEKIRSSSAPSFESMGERISSMLRLAEEEAADLRQSATQETSAMRTEAEQLHAAAAEAERTASERATNVEAKAKAHAEQTVAEAEEQAGALLAESEAKRQRDEDDFEIALNARRSEAQRLEAEREKSSRELAEKTTADADAHAHQTVADADAHAKQVVADAQAESARIQAETEKFAADLTATTQSSAARMTSDAEGEVHRLRTVRASVARQIMDVGALISSIPQDLAEDPAPLAAAESSAPESSAPGPASVPAESPAPVTDEVAVPAENEPVVLVDASADPETPGSTDPVATEKAAAVEDDVVYEVTVPGTTDSGSDGRDGVATATPFAEPDPQPASERTVQVSAVRPRRPSPGLRRQ